VGNQNNALTTLSLKNVSSSKTQYNEREALVSTISLSECVHLRIADLRVKLLARDLPIDGLKVLVIGREKVIEYWCYW
jgi:hypothetical protein